MQMAVANHFDIFDDKIVLLNFMYSTCTDVNGCPLATAVFHKVRNILNKDPKIGKQVSLISLSLIPIMTHQMS